ncbi:Uncharacterized protein, DUF1810 family [Loktanella fryxellensis]|uniref:Uncharacterized protein, DUF1810 family n=1 Tax=Loktanella fryxellensis TaxID=245187 RepID=A0A1H8J329_9RHOB|nr:DUF1810 family protein [Loktanella fryxellensis]SEN75059.1 Uncharacterized protein, DUF1810 family [Loktanella fryxellensis]
MGNVSDDFDDDEFNEDFDEDEDEFDHFVAAQETVHDTVIAELTAGQKQTHWMWFTFPVLTGIGQSPMAMFYSLRDAGEARDYLAHPLLGARLQDDLHLLLDRPGADPVAILGETDAYKLRACATLFEAASPTTPVFATALDTLFDGQRCTKTQRILRSPPADDLFS